MTYAEIQQMQGGFSWEHLTPSGLNRELEGIEEDADYMEEALAEDFNEIINDFRREDISAWEAVRQIAEMAQNQNGYFRRIPEAIELAGELREYIAEREKASA